MSHSPWSEIRRPMTPEHRVKIDPLSAEMDAALRHEIWDDRIAKAPVRRSLGWIEMTDRHDRSEG